MESLGKASSEPVTGSTRSTPDGRAPLPRLQCSGASGASRRHIVRLNHDTRGSWSNSTARPSGSV